MSYDSCVCVISFLLSDHLARHHDQMDRNRPPLDSLVDPERYVSHGGMMSAPGQGPARQTRNMRDRQEAPHYMDRAGHPLTTHQVSTSSSTNLSQLLSKCPV